MSAKKILFYCALVFLFFGETTSYAIANEETTPWSELTAQEPFYFDGAMHGFVQQPSTDASPVYIRFNEGLFFKIPRNDLLELTDVAYGHGKPQVFFRAEFLYPTFSGATPDTLQVFDFRSWKISPNIITLIGPLDDTGHPNKNILAAEKGAADKTEAGPYGLTKVTQHPIGKNTDAYYSIDSNDGDVFFYCDKAEVPGGVRLCTTEINLNQDYVLRYQYRWELLPHWKEIHEHMLSFINASLRKG